MLTFEISYAMKMLRVATKAIQTEFVSKRENLNWQNQVNPKEKEDM